jgi:hypothetical protein
MTLQSSGAISLSNVSVELGRSASATISLGEAAVRTLAGVASGPISLSNLYGKSNLSFTPAGGVSSGAAEALSDQRTTGSTITISCSQLATWTHSRTGSTAGTASVASGGTASSITFTLDNFTTIQRMSKWTVSGSAGGVVRYWTVQLVAEGFA